MVDVLNIFVRGFPIKSQTGKRDFRLLSYSLNDVCFHFEERWLQKKRRLRHHLNKLVIVSILDKFPNSVHLLHNHLDFFSETLSDVGMYHNLWRRNGLLLLDLLSGTTKCIVSERKLYKKFHREKRKKIQNST